MRLERPDLGRLWGVLASVVGVCIIGVGSAWHGGGPPAETRATMLADLLLIGAVLSWGGYLTVSKPLVMRHGSMPVLTATFLAGALLDLPIALIASPAIPPLIPGHADGLDRPGVLTLFITPVNLACQNLAMRRLDASQVANFSNVSPILTVVWGAWLFGEALTASLVVGGTLTLAGVFWTGEPLARGRWPAVGRSVRASSTARASLPGGPAPSLPAAKDNDRNAGMPPSSSSRRRSRATTATTARRRVAVARGLAVYVTSHGFGHLNRTAAVVNRIPRGVPVSIRSHPNLFDHWRQRVTRPIELGAYVSDVGGGQSAGRQRATDGPATLELAIRVHAEAMARLDDEVDWLRDAADCRHPLRRAGRPAGGGPSGGGPRVRDVQLHLGRYLCPPCPGRWAARPSGWSPTCASAYRHATALFRIAAGPADGVAEAGDRRRHGRQPGPQPPRRAGAQPRPVATRSAGLPLHRPIRPERPGLVAAASGSPSAESISSATIPRRAAGRRICTSSRRPTGPAAT